MLAKLMHTEKVVIVCPGCDMPTDYSTEHLWNDEERFGRSWGPWYCSNCGIGFEGKVLNGAGMTEIEICPDRKQVSIYVLLEHVPAEACCEPIYIVLDTTTTISENETFEQAIEGLDYLYGEHTCPTNWMRGKVCKIRFQGNSDPHGVFEYFAAVRKTEDLDDPFELFEKILKKKDRVF